MKLYNYYTLGALDAYGQPGLSDEPVGTIKMAINTISQSIGDSIKYKEASYLGLTLGVINDTYVIDKDGEKLKVLYVNPLGRYTQVFMREM
jgi:hypothetical protein